MKFEAARIHFLSDVFVAVAVIVAYRLPINTHRISCLSAWPRGFGELKF